MVGQNNERTFSCRQQFGVEKFSVVRSCLPRVTVLENLPLHLFNNRHIFFYYLWLWFSTRQYQGTIHTSSSESLVTRLVCRDIGIFPSSSLPQVQDNFLLPKMALEAPRLLIKWVGGWVGGGVFAGCHVTGVLI